MTDHPPLDLDQLPETSLDQQAWPTLDQYLEVYYQKMGTQGEGLKTYLDPFDQKLEGLRGIVIIGGEPGSGKTALALQIGFDTALDGRPVLIYSFEMPKDQLVTRLFQRAGKISYKKMQQQVDDLLSDDHARLVTAQQQIGKAANRMVIREIKDFFFEDKEGSIETRFNFTEQIQQINRMTAQYGKPPLVIIDSLHEIPVDSKGLRSTELKQKIDHIMLNLRFMCDQTGATFLLISHQSRSGQKEGGLQSFLGSASIEYTVDMALTVSIPKDTDGKLRNETDRELTVNKNRYGPRPKALLDFNGKYMDFTFTDML